MRNQLLALALLVAGCSGSDAPAAVDAAAGVPDAEVGKDRDCADTFGDVLTDSFGRVDGTVVAIVEPGITSVGGMVNSAPRPLMRSYPPLMSSVKS